MAEDKTSEARNQSVTAIQEANYRIHALEYLVRQLGVTTEQWNAAYENAKKDCDAAQKTVVVELLREALGEKIHADKVVEGLEGLIQQKKDQQP